MVLYHMNHGAYLPLILAHRLKVHKNKKAILILDGDGKKIIEGDKLVENKIFDKVLYCNVITTAELVELKSIEGAEIAVKDSFDIFFSKNNLKINFIEEIITSADIHHNFAVYLSLIKSNYKFIELLPNYFLNNNNLERKRLGELQKIYDKHGVFKAASEFATPILQPGSENFYTKKVEYFDFNKEINNIDINSKKRILNTFLTNEWDMKKNPMTSIFVPTSQSCTKRLLRKKSIVNNFENPYMKQVSHVYHLSNQIVLDYYLSEELSLVFKPHPRVYIKDDISETYYESAIVINNNFNTQFFDFIPELKSKSKFKCGITLGTIAIVDSIVEKNISLSRDIIYDFYLHHKIFTILSYIQENFADKTIYVETKKGKAIFDELLNNFFSSSVKIENIEKLPDIFERECIYILDSKKIRKKYLTLPKSSLIFIINSSEEFHQNYFIREKHMNNLLCITINKEKNKEKILDYFKNENIYVYTRGLENQEKIKSFSIEKKLKYTGITYKTSTLVNPEIRSYMENFNKDSQIFNEATIS